VGPTQAAVFFAIEPVVAALASRLTLGDRLNGMQWIGGGLILVALLIPSLGKDSEGKGAEVLKC
jgi:drug/metabolite transporter (DMT)-like permease